MTVTIRKPPVYTSSWRDTMDPTDGIIVLLEDGTPVLLENGETVREE
jgi:hypothetical protein